MEVADQFTPPENVASARRNLSFLHLFCILNILRSFFKTASMSVFWAAVGTLRSNDADDNENVQNTTGLIISKTTTSHVHHTFLYISFPFLHDYDVKMPHFAFYRGRKQATTKFFSLSELEFCPLKFSFRRVRLQLTK